MSVAKILVADDDTDLVLLLCHVLKLEGFEPIMAFDGSAAWKAFQSQKPDLVVLDRVMPEVDGLELCKRIRSCSSTPILMLTADAREESVVVALEDGADDYITKPFRPRQLLARIRAILRRSREGVPIVPGSDRTIAIGPVTLDLKNFRAFINGREVHLTPTEFKILHTLMANADNVVETAPLIRRVWGFAPDGSEGMVRVHIRRLRRKIEADPSRPRFILTRKGVGYMFQRPRA